MVDVGVPPEGRLGPPLSVCACRQADSNVGLGHHQGGQAQKGGEHDRHHPPGPRSRPRRDQLHCQCRPCPCPSRPPAASLRDRLTPDLDRSGPQRLHVQTARDGKGASIDQLHPPPIGLGVDDEDPGGRRPDVFGRGRVYVVSVTTGRPRSMCSQD